MAHPPLTVDWQHIDTVLLDMDGTLLDLHYDSYFWLEFLPLKVSEREGISLQSAKQYVLPKLREAFGTLPGYCIDYWSDVFTVDILALKRQVSDKIAVREGSIAFLKHLRAGNKRIVLATNAHRATIDLKFEKTGLQPFFDDISSSHDYGYAKEHHQYWRSLAQSQSIDLTRSLFIDDNRQVLASAKANGVACVIGVRQPDSQLPPLAHNDYPMTNDFSELLTAGAAYTHGASG